MRLAKQVDDVGLVFQLQEAPLYDYDGQFNRIARNCNTTFNPTYAQYCHHVDFIVGDYYPMSSRVMQLDFTPPLSSTAGTSVFVNPASTQSSPLTSSHPRKVASGATITTLEEAQAHQAPVCLLEGSYFDNRVRARWPDGNYTTCAHHDECLALLKQQQQPQQPHCVLFVDDELQLKHRVVKDADLEVSRERFDVQPIAWPLAYLLDPEIQRLLKRWVAYATQRQSLH